MQTKNSSKFTYSSILKSTGAFGSTHVFSTIIGLVTTKIIALLLGPNGIGILGLLKNSINLIASFTNFGFPIASVKEIATHANHKNKKELYKSIKTVLRLSIFIGIFGSLITVILSPLLSQWIFNDRTHWGWFILLAINFPLLSYNIALLAILQGLQQRKLIIYSAILVALTTAAVSIPCYFFFNKRGIIPSILLSNTISIIINSILSKPFTKDIIKLSGKDFLEKIKPIIRLGLLLSVNIVFSYFANFFIKLFLKNYGDSPNTLGYYEVGLQILTSYFGIVFNAMILDFFPKLNSVGNDNFAMRKLVNYQIEIALLLTTPLIVLMYSFSKIILKLLYSSSFENVDLIFKFGLFAVLIKAIYWPIGYVFLAKNDRKQYLMINLIGDVSNVIINIYLYKKIGLIGLGLSMLINYLIFGFYSFWFIKKKYNYSFNSKTKKIIFYAFILGGLSLISSIYFQETNRLIFNLLLLILSITYSWKEISSQTNLINFINKKRNH